MTNRRTTATCHTCRAVLYIPPGDGPAVEFVRSQGWTTIGNAMTECRCPYCRKDGTRVTRPERELSDTDREYRKRREAREQADRELLEQVAEQHRRSAPAQPVVERLHDSKPGALQLRRYAHSKDSGRQ